MENLNRPPPPSFRLSEDSTNPTVDSTNPTVDSTNPTVQFVQASPQVPQVPAQVPAPPPQQQQIQNAAQSLTGEENILQWLLYKKTKDTDPERNCPIPFEDLDDVIFNEVKGELKQEDGAYAFEYYQRTIDDRTTRTCLCIPVTWTVKYKDDANEEEKEFNYQHKIMTNVEITVDMTRDQLEKKLEEAVLIVKAQQKYMKTALSKPEGDSFVGRINDYATPHFNVNLNINAPLKKREYSITGKKTLSIDLFEKRVKQERVVLTRFEKSKSRAFVKGLDKFKSFKKFSKVSKSQNIHEGFEGLTENDDISNYKNFVVQQVGREIDQAKDAQLFFTDKIARPNIFKRALAKIIEWKYGIDSEGKAEHEPKYSIPHKIYESALGFWNRQDVDAKRYRQRVERDPTALSSQDQMEVKGKAKGEKSKPTYTEKVHKDSYGLSKVLERCDELKKDALKKLENAKKELDEAQKKARNAPSQDLDEVNLADTKYNLALQNAKKIEMVHTQNVEYAEAAVSMLKESKGNLKRHLEQLQFLQFHDMVTTLKGMDDSGFNDFLNTPGITKEQKQLFLQLRSVDNLDMAALAGFFLDVKDSTQYKTAFEGFVIQNSEHLELYLKLNEIKQEILKLSSSITDAEKKKQTLINKKEAISREIESATGREEVQLEQVSDEESTNI